MSLKAAILSFLHDLNIFSRELPREPEKDLTEEINKEAYLLAVEDNFTKRPEEYWFKAERKIKRSLNVE
jgi:hypothetical protein